MGGQGRYDKDKLTKPLPRRLGQLRGVTPAPPFWDDEMASLARPELPFPKCRVILVCGPPAAGKSTYVREHRGAEDIVIDYDLIAQEFGLGRQRPDYTAAKLLRARNERLAALSQEPPDRVAWVIAGAPSPAGRRWWQLALGVKPEDVVLLKPDRRELIRRIMDDPERLPVRSLHVQLVDRWLDRESEPELNDAN